MSTTTNYLGHVTTASVDMRQLAIEQVLKKMDEWFALHDCRGTDRFCEQFGCDSLAELLKPLEVYREGGRK